MSKEKKNDLTVKIFALVIAIILWSYVMNEVNPRMTSPYRNIEVKYLNLDELERSGLALMSPQELKVDVKVSGKRNDLKDISEKDIIAEVDLSGYSEGTKRVPIYLNVPNRVEIVDYSPKEVSFKFESIVSKEKPVNLKIIGELDSGYSLGKGEVKPQSVFLKGPKSWVNSVNDVLAVVDVTDKTSDIKISCPIKLIDEKGKDIRGVEKDPNVVEVLLPIYKTKKVPIEIQTIGELPDDYQISNFKVTPKTVEIKGYEDVLSEISSIKTVPIDINELLSNSNVETDLVLPEGVELVKPNTKVKVELNLERIATKSIELEFNDINVKNLEEGLSIENGDSIGNVVVNIKGQERILNNITKASLTPEIDLSGLDEGTHEVKVNITDIEGVTVENIVPSDITIVLKKQ
ncbi:CdaR family protein [Anaerosalibacter sp. Marseille-P3206]|uniref:CdaR family protein n=1 Tax=Anaerosalibacter sp. Marseille-P3206 TaxID=1871005 RepID=UPI000986AD09|nr:CdaR family protein [Anaerosalibacter sp. Marseille-P3206]